ncbi:MAG: non-ribosomal peptide synthetase, partial [Acidimicrobiales bacterium]
MVLSRLAGQSGVVIGTPTANRGQTALEGLIGFFVNTLALRVELSDEPTVAELLARVKTRALEAQAHEALPFERVVELVNPTRRLAHHPVFQVMFSWQNAPMGRLMLPALTLAPVGAGAPGVAAKFDLELGLSEQRGRIAGQVEYACALWERATIERHVGYLQAMLTGLAAAAAALPVDAIDVLSPTEREQVVAGWNDTVRAWPVAEEPRVMALIAAQAARTPAAVAVRGDDGVAWSYATLLTRAARVAAALQAGGVGPESVVGVLGPREPAWLAALLGIWLAGGAYLPLDLRQPVGRLATMVQQARSRHVLVAPSASALLDEVVGQLGAGVSPWRASWTGAGMGEAIEPIEPVEAIQEAYGLRALGGRPAVEGRQLAYVLFTSGSTGRPKGALLEQAGLVNHLWAKVATLGLTAADAVAQTAAVSFDISVWQLVVPLLVGGRVEIVGEAVVYEPAQLAAAVVARGVTVLELVPSQMPPLLPLLPLGPSPDRALRWLLATGEALPVGLARQWLAGQPGCGLVNAYGPTECSDDVTQHELTGALDAEAGGVPIGGPLLNTRLYVLDGRGELMPVGVVGELYVGGQGVGRGYAGAPAQTAERFVPDPFGAVGSRLYRTGDRVRWLPGGELVYLGRTDLQVKVRGQRIELGEIEAVLAAHPGVEQAVVLAREDAPGDVRLVAYVVGAAAEVLAADALRAYLTGRLPAHMVPAAYVPLATLPLMSSGKTDRGALPAPESDAYATQAYEAPVGDVELALAEIWASLLKAERVGRQDDFFALGGHSLLAVTLIERMRREGLRIDVRTLFMTPTLAALAAAVGSAEGDGVVVPPNGIVPGCTALTPAMLPLVTLSQAELDAVIATVPGGTANVQDVYPLAPLQEGIFFHHLLARDDDPYLTSHLFSFATRERLDAYLAALEAVIARHDILRTAVVWEELSEPVQVVWRRAPLRVEEVLLAASATTGDAARGAGETTNAVDRLYRRVDPRRSWLDVRRAPMLHALVARDVARDAARSAGDGQRWLLLLQRHHLVSDHTTLEVLHAEVEAHLLGRADQLPEPVPFRNYVAHARFGVSREAHEHYFRTLLADVTEPTTPFGLVDVHGDGSAVEEARLPVGAALGHRLHAQ